MMGLERRESKAVHSLPHFSQTPFQNIFFFSDRVSLYSPGCPGAHFVDQAGLELRNLPASAFQVLGLKACATAAPALYFTTVGIGCVEQASLELTENPLCLPPKC
jgi:hypothetical protein